MVLKGGEKMLYIEHPNKLAKLRQEAHLSQKQLAQELGVSQSSINYWENGGRTPSVKAAQKISEYFKIPISEIFAPYKDELCTSSVAISDAIEKAFKERQYSITFTSDEYSSEELQSIQMYASFLKSQRIKTSGSAKIPEYKKANKTHRNNTDVLAAHARTDIEQTSEGVQHDLDIMDDDSEWD